MKIKKLFAVVLSFLMVISSTCIAFAQNGPNRYLAYILIYSKDYSTEVYLCNNYTTDSTGTIKGATYDKSTNTLTLNSFNKPELSIETNTMGDDFKIKLTGENHIQSLRIWGDAHGGSCEFTGSGKLFVNENKEAKDAILLVPEGASSNLKASGSTTITAYSASGNNSLRISGTDNKNCIKGTSSSTPKVENCRSAVGVSVITKIDSYANTYDVYKLKNSTAKFTLKIDKWTNATYVYIYQLVENPEDDNYILCPFSTERLGADVEVNPADFNLTKTDETVEARKTDYDTYVPLWNDKNGNEYVFLSTWNWDTFEEYYQQAVVSKFVKSQDSYGNTIQWYKSTPVENAVEYKSESEIAEAGFTQSTITIDGLYNIIVTASPYTLKAGAHTHTYATTKATLSKNGTVKCKDCGAVKSTIYYPKTITLSATSYNYDGKVKKPTVTVKDSKGKTIAASNYTVSYASGRKNVGKYAVKITFKGNYSGTKTLYFTIKPKGTSISSVSAQSKAFTVKWKKQATQTTGYQIQYATDSKFTKGVKTVTVSKNSTTSSKVSKLTGKKKYYVRIRTYKTVSGTKYYSSWSGAKNITTKK